jgi:hypothetical protein
MAKLERTECTFAVKEWGDGVPYVLAEPITASGPLIGFDLTPGATLDDGHKVARFMRAPISGISMSWGMADY